MFDELTLEELQTELQQVLGDPYDVVRGDDSLCIRINNDPVVYLQIEETPDGQQASLNFAVGCNPAVAAYIAVSIDCHIFVAVDTENLFTATRLDYRELS